MVLKKEERLKRAMELFIASLAFYSLLFFTFWSKDFQANIAILWLNLFVFFIIIFLTLMFYNFGKSLNFWLKLKIYTLYYIIVMVLFGLHMAFAFWISYFLSEDNFFEELGKKIRKMVKEIRFMK